MRTIVKKTGVLIGTLVIISMLAFLAFQIIPGDPTTKLLGDDWTEQRAASLREELGLTGNVFVRYGRWLVGFVTGDAGTSYSYDMPVSEVLDGKIGATAALSVMSWLMVIVLAVPAGIALARMEGRGIDRALSGVNQVMMAVPPFFLGIVLTWLFGIVFRVFVPGQYISLREDFWGGLGYLVFPALAIALPKAAMVTRLLRAGIVKQLKDEDYVRTAFSRGNSRRVVIRRHVLRNALLPVITFVAMTLADIVAGSIIIEQVFVIPGMGRMLLLSISNRDYPVVQAIVVIISFVVVFMNYLADLVNRLVDPRIRLS